MFPLKHKHTHTYTAPTYYVSRLKVIFWELQNKNCSQKHVQGKNLLKGYILLLKNLCPHKKDIHIISLVFLVKQKQQNLGAFTTTSNYNLKNFTNLKKKEEI